MNVGTISDATMAIMQKINVVVSLIFIPTKIISKNTADLKGGG